jgi:hypothetical protein
VPCQAAVSTPLTENACSARLRVTATNKTQIERLADAALEPIVSDTSSISWQVFKALQSVKMVNRNLRHGLWFC